MGAVAVGAAGVDSRCCRGAGDRGGGRRRSGLGGAADEGGAEDHGAEDGSSTEATSRALGVVGRELGAAGDAMRVVLGHDVRFVPSGPGVGRGVLQAVVTTVFEAM